MAAATLSPRISFSHDLDISSSSAAADVPRRLDASLMLPSDDFDFSTSREISAAPDPSPADELFAYGMLLPLSSVKQAAATRIEKPPGDKKPENLNPNAKSPSPSPSYWTNIGRSSSVGTGSKSRLASICPFPRSKSTGSYQNPSQNQGPKMRNMSKIGQRQIQSQRENQNAKNWYSYYYSRRSSKRSSHGNEVRINPVINVPAHFIPRGGSTGGSSTTSGGGGGGGGGFFAYLLCNCRDKNFKELEGYSP